MYSVGLFDLFDEPFNEATETEEDEFSLYDVDTELLRSMLVDGESHELAPYYLTFYLMEAKPEEFIEFIQDEDVKLKLKQYMLGGELVNYFIPEKINKMENSDQNKYIEKILSNFKNYYKNEKEIKFIRDVIDSELIMTSKKELLREYGKFIFLNCLGTECVNRFSNYLDKIYEYTKDIELYYWTANDFIGEELQISSIEMFVPKKEQNKYLSFALENNSIRAINETSYIKSKNIFDIKKENVIVLNGEKYFLINEYADEKYDVKVLASQKSLNDIYLYVVYNNREYISIVNENKEIYEENRDNPKRKKYDLNNYNIVLIDINNDGEKEVVIEKIFLTGDNTLAVATFKNDEMKLTILRSPDLKQYYAIYQDGNGFETIILDDYGDIVVSKESKNTVYFPPFFHLKNDVGFIIDEKVYYRLKNIANFEVTLDENFDVKLKVIDPTIDELNLSKVF